jgi:hypothetical protein
LRLGRCCSACQKHQGRPNNDGIHSAMLDVTGATP